MRNVRARELCFAIMLAAATQVGALAVPAQAAVPSPRHAHSAIYDPIRNRLVVFGGYYGGPLNDVWVLPLSGPPTWSQLSPTPDYLAGLPGPRYAHTAIYDPVRDRMIVFGGAGPSFNDVWALELSGAPAWSKLTPAGTPPDPRYYSSAILDPIRNRMIVFGGFGGAGALDDVWELSLSGPSAWSRIEPAGERPARRGRHAAVYDPVRDRMMICGGGPGDNDTWTLPLGGAPAWERLATPGATPLPRVGHSAIYDAAGDRLILFGGNSSGVYRHNDTWSLPLGGEPIWTQVVTQAMPPPGRTEHASACDGSGGRLVIFGGNGTSNNGMNDTWVLPLRDPAWSMIQPVVPPAPTAPVPVFIDTIAGVQSTLHLGQSFTLTALVRNDGIASDDGRIVFGFPSLDQPGDASRVSSSSAGDVPGVRVIAPGGGIDGASCEPRTASYLVAEYADQDWDEFSGETQRFDLRVTPRAAGTFYVEVRSTMRAAGGAPCDWANGLPANGEAGFVDQQGWAVKRFAITVLPLPPPGSEPVRRRLHAAIHDPLRNRMLAFGGWVGAPNAEIWALSLGPSPEWSFVFADVGPSPRYGHSAIYDPVRDRMIVFGGFDDQRRNDVWALSLSGQPVWTRIDPVGQAPEPRRYHSAIYDPVRDRMVVFGGTSSTVDLNDAWALELAAPRWTPLPSNQRPPWRKHHAAAYDPVRDQMLVFGGATGGTTLYDDVWAYSFTGTVGWSPVSPAGGRRPLPRSGHTLTWDPGRDRMWIVGGFSGAYENDTWTFAPASRTWEQVATWGGPMPQRELHTTIADPGADRLVVYGGTDSLGRRGDTWFLSRSGVPTWRELGGEAPPPPPSDPVPVFAAQVGGLPASITIGQSFQVTVSVRNDGLTSDDGRISLGFPGFTGPGDALWVSAPQDGGYPGVVESAAGATLRSATCQPLPASYLVAEYADSSWQAFGIETHSVTFTVQPRAVGAFHIDVRATMHRAGATGCETVHGLPDSGMAGVDQQGWPVRRFTVQVLPPDLQASPRYTGWPQPVPSRITLGQTISMSVEVANVGAVSDDGRIVLGFPSLTAPGDSAFVTGEPGGDLPGYRELVAGTTLTNSTCAPVIAPYLTVEYADNDWRSGDTESNRLIVQVRPREAGTFTIDLRSTMRTLGLGACAYVNRPPPGGTSVVTDPQGWTVTRYAVTVDPPPTAAGPELSGLGLSSRELIIGRTFNLTLRGTNRGAASDDGRFVVGFPSFTDSADVDRVHGYNWNGGEYREIAAGGPLTDSLCNPVTAGHLVVEAVDHDWQWLGLEAHQLDLVVTPRQVGTFFVDVRTTMRTAGAGACAYVNAVPASGDTLVVDPQGWLVRRFAVTVLAQPPPNPNFIGLIGPAQTSITVGQSFFFYATVLNQGWTSDDGRICVSFPSFTSGADTSGVTGPVTPEYREYAAGDTIARSDCQLMAASHLMVELVDPQWRGIDQSVEQHELRLQVTPPDTGDFTIRLRSTMRVSAGPGCVYENESMGESDLDQQGWTVRTFTVHVNPPPPTAPAFLGLSEIPASISLGESFTVVATVRNDGGESGDGRISFGFPGFTALGDAQWVTGTGGDDLPGLVEYPPGSTRNTATCQTVAVGYLTAEYVDHGWRQTEINTVSLQVQPQAQGTFYLDVRTTMRDTALSGGPCSYLNALPPNGADGNTDPQGWAVKRFAVQVGPPLGPPTVSWWPMTTPAAVAPSARTGATAVYDTRRQSMVLYGGADPSYRVDVWALPLASEGAAWSPILPGGSVPLRRIMHSMIYNQRDDQLVIFAGLYDDFLNDMVVVPLAPNPWWFRNPGYGAPPAARGGHVGVYDPLRERMLVIGGYGGGVLRNDVWEYAPAGQGTWRQLAATGTPMPPRAQHAAIYDPVRDRIVVFGGDGGTFRNDVWALNLTDPPSWEQLTPGGTAPTGRREHTAIYDPVGDRMIVFGGFDGSRRDDLWALSLDGAPAWSRLVSSTAPPAGRYGHTAIYDPERRRMVMFGGSLANGLSGELWALNIDPPTPVALTLASSEVTGERVRLTWTGEGLASVRTALYRAAGEDAEWTEIGSPSVEAGQRLVFEDRAIEPGRRYGYRLVAWDGEEQIELSPVWLTVPERAVLALAGASPNPAQGEMWVAFSLSDDRAATLELFDLKGRRVASRAVGGFGMGAHRVSLSGGERLPAGVYLVRLTRGAEVLHAKAAIVR